jgi:putative hemolysin
MSLSTRLRSLLDTESHLPAKQRALRVMLAATEEDIRAAQRLRHRVFVEEMGARLTCREPGIESDRFDEFCQHLIVCDLATEQVVGCYRLLTDLQAVKAGGYYAQTEFDLTRLLAMPGRFVEVGRSCVHPDYRTGSTLALLWQGLARFMLMNKIDYLMGCASIPLHTGTAAALTIYRRLSHSHLAPAQWRVYPRVPLPRVQLTGAEPEARIPALIGAYLRAGARLCGEPAWDPQFNVADLFLMLRADQISRRYARAISSTAGDTRRWPGA